ncbi:MAG TPA: hypothetical protein PK299_04270 [Anaerolineales bacterium]|nr:hypothetical protein [Anaerolineales bacterium]
MTSAVDTLTARILASKKYKDTAEETVRQLASECLARYATTSKAEAALRERLHNIMAPYLGDPNYQLASQRLSAAFASGTDAVQSECRALLASHDSTRERLDLLETFYPQLWAVTGIPNTVLDIASGLNPLAFPWMGMSPQASTLYAYEIHLPRVALLNHYFALQGLPQTAKVQDVAIQFPSEQADVALFLKELPRFEKNYGQLGLKLLQALQAQWVVVSFPAISLHGGGRSLVSHYRAYFEKLIAGQGWHSVEVLFPNELVYCIRK